MKQPTTTAGATTPSYMAMGEPVMMQKRIGSTTYMVSVHFNPTSKETMNDKILRLIRNEATSGKAVGQ